MQKPYQDGVSEADTEQCSGATYQERTNRGALESQLMGKRCQEQEGTAQKPSMEMDDAGLPITTGCLGKQHLREDGCYGYRSSVTQIFSEADAQH